MATVLIGFFENTFLRLRLPRSVIQRGQLSAMRSLRKPSKSRQVAYVPVGLRISAAAASRPFSAAATGLQLPPVMSEEKLEYYGLVFRHRGFVNLGMTFEQFLAVAAKLGAFD